MGCGWKYKREPARVALRTEPHADGHTHRAIFDDNGNGNTTTNAGHYHVVRDLVALPGQTPESNHSHELSDSREEVDAIEDEAEAEPRRQVA